MRGVLSFFLSIVILERLLLLWQVHLQRFLQELVLGGEVAKWPLRVGIIGYGVGKDWRNQVRPESVTNALEEMDCTETWEVLLNKIVLVSHLGCDQFEFVQFVSSHLSFVHVCKVVNFGPSKQVSRQPREASGKGKKGKGKKGKGKEKVKGFVGGKDNGLKKHIMKQALGRKQLHGPRADSQKKDYVAAQVLCIRSFRTQKPPLPYSISSSLQVRWSGGAFLLTTGTFWIGCCTSGKCRQPLQQAHVQPWIPPNVCVCYPSELLPEGPLSIELGKFFLL